MKNSHFIMFLGLCSVTLAVAKGANKAKYKIDPLLKSRCDLVCWETPRDEKNTCKNKCQNTLQKPGTCPATTGDQGQWAATCVQACSKDTHCDGTQLCCNYGCSRSCEEPFNLLDLPGLPALPVVANVNEKRKSIKLSWSSGVGDLARAVPGRVFYVVQEQHHLGPKYEEARLGPWSMLLRTNKTRATLRNVLKPGRWYRFRVASVNAAGSRGYSAPTAPFTVRRGPRAPSPPRGLRVKKIQLDDDKEGKVTIRLEWKPAKSDLPISRYKVFWSRRVKGLTGELDSVLVNHQSVPKEQTYIDITDLQPNSRYFLQVQTLSQYGTTKLRSEKASIFINTTTDTIVLDQEPSESRQRVVRQQVSNVKLVKIIWQDQSVRGRIKWDPVPSVDGRPTRYVIQWTTIGCENPTPLRESRQLIATTERTTFDLYDLEYACKYSVFVNRYPVKTKTPPESILAFTVPACRHFAQRANSSSFVCPDDDSNNNKGRRS